MIPNSAVKHTRLVPFSWCFTNHSSVHCSIMLRATTKCSVFRFTKVDCTLCKSWHTSLNLTPNNIFQAVTYRSIKMECNSTGQCGSKRRVLSIHCFTKFDCTLCKNRHTSCDIFSCSPPHSTSEATASCNADHPEQARVRTRRQVLFRSLRSWYS